MTGSRYNHVSGELHAPLLMLMFFIGLRFVRNGWPAELNTCNIKPDIRDGVCSELPALAINLDVNLIGGFRRNLNRNCYSFNKKF
jgi:hypothetical protein